MSERTFNLSGRPRTAATWIVIAALSTVAASCADSEAKVTSWSADHPVAIVALDADTVLYAERLTGRVLSLDLNGVPRSEYETEAEPVQSATVIGEVDVDASGEQRGIIGLTRIGDRTFGAWVRPADLRLVVGDIETGTIIWEGPVTDTKGFGGHLEVLDGQLVLGLGELVDDPQLAGTIITLDPDGTADQQPEVLSRDWNNPFAFVIDAGKIVVADNAPDGEVERLDGLPFPETAQRAPSAIVVFSPGRYGVCGYLDGEMRGYRIDDGEVQRSGTLVESGCRTSAARLTDGRLVVADDETITLIEPSN
jgi:hypothetical protein